MKKTTRLRQLLKGDEFLVAPGAFNALSAKLIEEAGFQAGYITGAGIANTMLGVADVGLTTMSEVAQQVEYICSVTGIPFIADGDTGYGNAVNLIRTVKSFEKAGAAGIQLEDQEFPKKCGHFTGKRVISLEEAVGKIRAAVDARNDPDFIIVARTDARAVLGLDAALERARAFAGAGADVLFVEAPQSKKELQQIASSLKGVPLFANMVEGGLTPLCSAEELKEMGFKLVIFANAGLRASVKAMQGIFKTLYETGSTNQALDQLITMEERNRITGLSRIKELEEKYI